MLILALNLLSPQCKEYFQISKTVIFGAGDTKAVIQYPQSCGETVTKVNGFKKLEILICTKESFFEVETMVLVSWRWWDYEIDKTVAVKPRRFQQTSLYVHNILEITTDNV